MAEVVLKFISSNENKHGLLSKAAKEAEKVDLKTEWVSASNLEDIAVDNDNSVLVFDSFSGDTFEEFNAKNFRIIGPPCLLFCLQEKRPLPNVKHPVYSMSMDGINITCTSVPKHERKRLCELIEWMNGCFARNLTDVVTHIVAGEVGSEKYRFALRYDKPIMLPDWVNRCWDECQSRLVHATDQEFNKYRTPCFKGCTVCVTGIETNKRKEIKKLTTLHGGTYSGELNMNTCTHLLVDEAKGEKYNFARKWKIQCVCSQWFYDCIKAGHWLEEADYRTLPDNEQSMSGQRLSMMNISTINSTTLSNMSMKSNGQSFSRTAAQAAYKSAQKHGDSSLISDTTKQNRVSSLKFPSKNESESIYEIDDAAFDVSVQPGNLFLDGCKIYLSGFNGTKLEKLRKIINSGGGTRFNQINESISHVVVGTRVEKDVEVLMHSSFQPWVVNAHWLLDSARKGKRLDEERYNCLMSLVSEEPTTAKMDRLSSGEKDRNTKSISSSKMGAHLDVDEDDDGNIDLDDDVFKQYLQDEDSQSALEQKLQVNQGGDQEAHTMQKTNAENHCEGDDEDITVDEIEEKKVLAGKTFRFVGFVPEQVSHLNELIGHFGGREGTIDDLVDFVVTPMNYEELVGNAKNVVTFCWLEQSVDAQQLLDPSSNWLFKPMRYLEGCKPLDGCVLSISQFKGTEREHLLQLAELLGAHCQEHFVRKSRPNLLASTHLLLQEPNGSKYDAAIKWDIPVVSREWLFACAKSGKMENYENYSVGCNGESRKPLDMVINALPPERKESISVEKSRTEKELTSKCENTKDKTEANIEANGFNKSYNSEEKNLPANVTQMQKTAVASKPAIQKSFRPSFDLTDALQEVASPLVSGIKSRKSRGSRQSFPLDDLFAENVQQALKNVVKAGEGQHEKADAPDTEKGIQMGEAKCILHGVILAVSKKLNTQQTELYSTASSLGADYRWIYDESCTHLIHQGRANDNTKEYLLAKERGIHIVSPHWLSACSSEGKRIDEIHYPHTYNPKMSLASVVTSGPKRMTRSSKQSLSSGKKDSSGDVQSESRTPSSPKVSAQKDCPASSGSASAPRQTEASHTTSEKPGDEGRAALVKMQSLEAQEELEKQLNELSKSKAARGRRRSRRLTSNSGVTHNASGLRVATEGELGARRTSARIRSRAPPLQNTNFSNHGRDLRNKSRLAEESEQSQSDHITYDDPDGRMEREKIMASIKKGWEDNTSDIELQQDNDKPQEEDSNVTVGAATSATKDSVIITETTNQSAAFGSSIKSEPPSPEMTPTPVAPPPMVNVTNSVKPEPVNLLNQQDPVSQSRSRLHTAPKFQLSAMSQEEKIDYCALIEQLAGRVYDTMYFNPACTHVVVGKPNRNEKYLAACAAGKWILHKSYLESSREAGFFVFEDPHEWGQEQVGEPMTKLALAARRWRIKLQERLESSSGDSCAVIGAFSGWKVILCVDKSKQPGFKRLLEAGGAKVVRIRPPFDDTDGVTHAFIDSSKGKNPSLDVRALQAADVWILKPEYIAEYLMQDPPPHPRKYLIPEAVKILEETEGRSDLSYSQQRKRKAEEAIAESKRSRIC